MSQIVSTSSKDVQRQTKISGLLN